jgi:hypothetical protein
MTATFSELCRDYLSNYVIFENDRCFVAGGFFPRFYHNLPIRDIDVYVNDTEYFEKLQGIYREMGFYYVREDPEFVSLEHPSTTRHFPNIDLIAFHEPKSVKIVESFDFNICQGWMNEEEHYIPEIAISTKSMRFVPQSINANFSTYSKSNNSLTRLLKYVSLGFTISEAELTLMHKAMIDYKPKR